MITIYLLKKKKKKVQSTVPPFRASSFPGSSVGKESACNARDPGSIPGSGKSAGEGNSHPLQYSGLENFMDYSPWGHKESDMTEQLSFSQTVY